MLGNRRGAAQSPVFLGVPSGAPGDPVPVGGAGPKLRLRAETRARNQPQRPSICSGKRREDEGFGSRTLKHSCRSREVRPRARDALTPASRPWAAVFPAGPRNSVPGWTFRKGHHDGSRLRVRRGGRKSPGPESYLQT